MQRENITPTYKLVVVLITYLLSATYCQCFIILII